MDFDTEKFITEVHNRPAIWKYTDKIQRYRDFKELAESYGAETDEEAKQIAIRLQKKWKNIRDSFVKTHKNKTGKLKPGKRKIEYAHYDQLLFLLDSECLTSNADETSTIAENTSHNIHNNFDDGPEFVKVETSEYEPSSSNDSWSRKRKKIEFEVGNTEAVREDDEAQLFLLSLVKEFNRIPERSRIQAKIDLLKVIKDAQIPDFD